MMDRVLPYPKWFNPFRVFSFYKLEYGKTLLKRAKAYKNTLKKGFILRGPLFELS
jgi:hypothetical protein